MERNPFVLCREARYKTRGSIPIKTVHPPQLIPHPFRPTFLNDRYILLSRSTFRFALLRVIYVVLLTLLQVQMDSGFPVGLSRLKSRYVRHIIRFHERFLTIADRRFYLPTLLKHGLSSSVLKQFTPPKTRQTTSLCWMTSVLSRRRSRPNVYNMSSRNQTPALSKSPCPMASHSRSSSTGCTSIAL